MNILNHRVRGGRICALTALCVAFAAFFHHNKPRTDDPNEGWKTTKELNRPFRQSLISNGIEPTEFQIILIEPSNDIKIGTNDNHTISLKVKVKFFDQAAINSDIAPTWVTAHVRRNKTAVASKSLEPYAREHMAYIYNGNISIPRNRGDYQLVIEVSYSVIANHMDEQIRGGRGVLRILEPFKKNLKGVTIHVGN
jgi:hypothetical protein